MATYTLTLAQQQSLTDAFMMGPQAIGQPGTHINFYIELANILSTDNGSGAPGDDAEIKPILIWAKGATKTNSDQGAFSTLIREYTHEQGVLHWQRRFTDFDLPGQISEMQEASNQIARNAFFDMRDVTGWQVQSIAQIANVDAVGVGEVLFDCPAGVTDCSSVVGDSITSDSETGGNNAAWSGVPFFSSFDDKNGVFPADETYRLLGPIDNPALDTLDDFRNVLYSHHSFNYGVVESIKTAGALVLDLEELGELAVDARTFFEVCMFSGRCDTTFATTVRGQVAEEASQPSLLYGVTDTVNLIKSGAEGVVNETEFEVDISQLPNVSFSTNFRDQARALFGPPGPQNQNIPASVERVDDLVLQAQGGDNIAKKALQGLSPFKIDNGVTVNLVASSQYWVDRGLMTKARLLFDAQDVLYAGSVTSSSFIDPVQFNDVASGISLEVDNNILPFSNFRKIEFGSDSTDALSGGDYKDSLYGLDGSDSLDGGLDNDFLSGGNGNDSYIVNDGRDIIFDSDGNGSIEFNGEVLIGGTRRGGSLWVSDDVNNRFTYILNEGGTGSQLMILDADNLDDLITIDQFSNNQLGIDLANFNVPDSDIDNFAPTDTGVNGFKDNYEGGSPDNDYMDSGKLFDNVVSDGGDDLVLLGEDSDRALTGFGNDTVYGEQGNDYIATGLGFNNAGIGPTDRDTVYGGDGSDLIWTGVGDDLIVADNVGDYNSGSTTNTGNWIVADEGNDVVYGSIDQDFISAGSGNDIVYGGGGFDVILGDGHYDFFIPANIITTNVIGARKHTWNGTDWDTVTATTTLLTPVDAFDFTLSILPNGDFDFSNNYPPNPAERVQVSPSTSNNDTIYAGADSDWVSGGMGNDFIFGEAGDDILYGDDLIVFPLANASDYGNDFISGGSGDDLLHGNAGDDVIHGGTGNDMIFGDDQGQTAGDDKLFGDDGVDELYGYGGNDYLSGGAGDEVVLFGGDDDDVIDGDAGNDILTGGAGNDNLRGGEGNDQLDGGDDNDVLNGGVGDDTLNGGADNDILFSSPGLNQLNGGTGDDVYIAVLNYSPIDTPDVINDSGGTDRIQFDELVFSNRIQFTDQGGDLLVQYSSNDALLVTGGAGGAVIEEYEFFDGRILSYADLTSVAKSSNHSKVGNVTLASSNEITAFDDWYEGDAGVQNLDMLAGNDAALGYEGFDILNGNAGNDLLDGGADNDTLIGGAGNDRLFGATGDDDLFGGNDNDLLAGGDGSDMLDGGSGIDVLNGGSGDDQLRGGDGNDYLQGDDGADTLEGGLGFDTYIFKSEDDPESGVFPQTTIVDTNDAGGNAIRFIGGLDANDITLINDLNTGDLEIQYAHSGNPTVSTIHIANSAQGEVVSEFQFSDGTTISFIDLCITQPLTCEKFEELIFMNGFEQTIVKKSIVVTSQKEAVYENNIGTSDIGGISSLPILTALLSQFFIK